MKKPHERGMSPSTREEGESNVQRIASPPSRWILNHGGHAGSNVKPPTNHEKTPQVSTTPQDQLQEVMCEVFKVCYNPP
jgi:hypothetical protein